MPRTPAIHDAVLAVVAGDDAAIACLALALARRDPGAVRAELSRRGVALSAADARALVARASRYDAPRQDAVYTCA